MIKLSDRFAIETGPREHDYCLVEFKQGRTRNGEEKISESRTYHPSIEQISSKIVKVIGIEEFGNSDEKKSIDDLIDAMNKVREAIEDSIHGVVK